MPAQNFSKSERVVWLYYDPINTPVPQQYVSSVVVVYKQQTGAFPAKKPKPLPVTTTYSTTQGWQSTAKYNTTVTGRPATPSNSRKYIGTPTAGLYNGESLSHDMGNLNEAITKLRSAVLNGNWDGGVFLGELKQTTNICVDSVLALADLIGSIRKARKGKWTASWRGVERSAKSLGALWLTYRYGWMPLIHDMKDATEVLSKKLSVYDQRCFVKSPKVTCSSSFVRDLAPGSAEVRRDTKIWFKTWFSPPASYSSLAARFASQLGLDAPLTVAWELVPFSFVVDWFIGVGEYLEALNKPSGFTFYNCENNYFTREVVIINPNGVKVYPTSIVFNEGSTCTRDTIMYNRFPSGYPNPRVPSFDPSLNPKRVADALALLAGNSRKLHQLASGS